MTKLVIVDDHEALREGLVALLQHGGIEVVGRGRQRRRRASTSSTVAEPDVAIVDIRLPDGSGIDLTRELLARRPDLGVILYTGDSDAELLYDGLDSGARGYALKAGSMDELMAAIERVAGGGSYVDPRLDRILLSPRATAHVPAALAARARDHAPDGRGHDRRGDRRQDQRLGRDRAHPRAQRDPQAAGPQPRPRDRDRARARRDRAGLPATSDERPTATEPTSGWRGSSTTCARR